ncbi:hypothetical protein VCHENC02_3643A, partial [Vibrio harveyi]
MSSEWMCRSLPFCFLSKSKQRLRIMV